MTEIDETHDPERKTWVPGADGGDFPVQNLPLGIGRRGEAAEVRAVAAIGDYALDIVRAAPLLDGEARKAAEACDGGALNRLMERGRSASGALRLGLSRLLSDTRRRADVEPLLVPLGELEMGLPAAIGDYTDFYASVFHATNVGALFRPDNPLLPNYKWVPIGYHGRASSIRPSGAPVRRPHGQVKAPDADAPTYKPSTSLDYEVELGLFIGKSSSPDETIPIGEADQHLFGACLLNDWSARDVQAWEYQPLGPFLAKNFATSISPWIVTAEALAPFRTKAYARPQGDPAPLPYLSDAADQARGGFDITMECAIRSPAMRAAGMEPHVLSRGSFADIYWTAAQMIAHHASNGCDLRAGDLLGSGTVSGAERGSLGSLLEITRRGQEPVELPGGERRAFLQDGDELILRGWCEAPGRVRIGFGVCAGEILPA